MAEANETELLISQIKELEENFTYGLNAVWVLVTGIGIILMQVGFMSLEVGVTRAKNVKATLFKNMVDHAVGAMAWYCVGFALFTGSHPFVAGDDTIWFEYPHFEYPRIFQQYGFAVTAATIVSGSLLSRCRLRVYVVFSFLLSLYIYPIVAHWCWVPGGFLYSLGYLDFAGSGVVHALGGICAFSGAIACGPRVGRFSYGESENSHSKSFNELTSVTKVPFRHKFADKVFCGTKFGYWFVDLVTLNKDPQFHVRDQPGHSAPMQCLGALLLYVAWFSFNAGSSGGMATIAQTDAAGRAAVNTMLAAASGTVTALLWSDLVRKQYEVDLVVNGLLAGMVAVTAPCGYVDPWAGIVVGILAIPVYVWTSNLVVYGLHVDDPIDATSVHYACGILGVLWTGLADINNGLFYTGSLRLLGVQALGALCITVWGLVNALIYFYGLKKIIPLMVCCLPNDTPEDNPKEFSLVHSPDAQLVGLDFLYFGGSGFPEFDVEAVSEFNATQRIKEKFRAKRVKTMRIFDREPMEGSTHGGKHMSGNFGGPQLSAQFSSSLLRAPSLNTMTSSAESSPRNSMAAPIGGKRPSQQAIVVDSQIFSMENPSGDGDDDIPPFDGRV